MLHHGGRLKKAARDYGIAETDWLDISTGVSPWAYPLSTVPEYCVHRLPEEQDGLEAIACHYYGTTSLLPVAGSQAAIQILPFFLPIQRSAGPVLLPRIGYQEHHAAWLASGIALDFYEVTPTAEQIAKCSALLVIQPNNPRGTHVSVSQLKHWQAELADRKAWLIIDEAFCDCQPELSMVTSTIPAYTVILRSLGKFFGLAGLRVGFVLAQPELLQALQERLGPWSVSGPSRYIAMQALEDNAWQIMQRQRLHDAGKTLRQQLSKIAQQLGGNVSGTPLFCRWEHPQAIQLHEQLCQSAVLTRLTDEQDAIRFGLPKTDADQERLNDALMKLVSSASGITAHPASNP